MFIKPKYYNGKVRLRKEGFANFYEYYHNRKTEEDNLYKFLNKIVKEHQHFIGDIPDLKFKNPLNNEGFYFKTTLQTKCKSIIKKPTIIDNILDRDVLVKLKVQPYDFVDSTGKRHIGVSITALEITAVHDKC